MENSNNDIPTEEPAREDTGTSVTTTTDSAPPSPPLGAPRSDDTRVDAASQSPPRKPKNNLARTLLVTLLLLVLGAACGVVLYKLYFEPKTTTTSNSSTASTSSSTVTTRLTAATLVDTLKTRMKATEVPTTTDNSVSIATTTDGKFGAFDVSYAQPTGYTFYTLPQTMVGFTVASNDQSVIFTDVTTARAYLADQGLFSGTATFDDTNSVISSSEFVNNDVRCTLAQTSYSYTAGAHQVQLGCADVSSYKANAELIQPLYKAYLAAHPEAAVTGLLFGRPTIKSSTVSGYQHASLSTGNIFSPVGGSIVALYRTPDNTWHYFANRQDEALCSEYTTTDLKKAFAGESCAMMDGTESKVTQ